MRSGSAPEADRPAAMDRAELLAGLRRWAPDELPKVADQDWELLLSMANTELQYGATKEEAVQSVVSFLKLHDQ
jgi:hypothetical protein